MRARRAADSPLLRRIQHVSDGARRADNAGRLIIRRVRGIVTRNAANGIQSRGHKQSSVWANAWRLLTWVRSLPTWARATFGGVGTAMPNCVRVVVIFAFRALCDPWLAGVPAYCAIFARNSGGRGKLSHGTLGTIGSPRTAAGYAAIGALVALPLRVHVRAVIPPAWLA